MRLAILTCLVAVALGAAAQVPSATAPRSEPASMRQLLARGVAPASVDAGLSFALTLTGGGKGILAVPWTLRVPGAPRPLKLSFERVRFQSGYLEAGVRLKNDSGVFLGGLRLDFIDIAEGTPQPTEAPAAVSGPAKSRPIALDSPIFFGDLEPGADAAITLRLGPIALTPGSPYAVIRGVVTGTAAAGSVEIADSSDPTAIDSDGEGRVYVADGAGKAIFALGPEANRQRKIPADCPLAGVAVRRKTGEVLASCRDAAAVLRLPLNGKLGRPEPVARALGPLRFGGKGFLYAAPSGIARLDALSIAEEISTASGQPLKAAGFDVEPDGTIWAVTAGSEGKLLRIKSARDIFVAAGPGDGLGALAAARTCRVGPDGAIYVLEGAAGSKPPSVTVFDRSGNLLRAWNLSAGEPVDLAFGSLGRLLVLSKLDRRALIAIFRPF